MGIKGFFARKILNQSDSYRYYKDQLEHLQKRLKKLEKDNQKLKALDKESKKLNKRYKKYDEINETNRRLFNTLYLDHELERSVLLVKFHTFCLEFIKFIQNVCSKHDIEWMIEGGSLLGAIRHGGFIPWDDDIDCGMMREDYNHFLEVLPDEIVKYELDDILEITFKPRDAYYEGATSFMQLRCENIIGEPFNIMMIDFFPYDFLKEYNGEDIEEIYMENKFKFFKDTIDYDDIDVILERYYDRFNLTYERTPYFIQGVEGTFSKCSAIRPKVYETDKMLPFKKVKFEDIELPAANDPNYYLRLIYKDYWQMPGILGFHRRMKRLRKKQHIYYILDEYAKRFKNINDNFEF